MVSKIPCYQTSDGVVHLSESEAFRHERAVHFKAWYKSYVVSKGTPLDTDLVDAILAQFDPFKLGECEPAGSQSGNFNDKMFSAVELTNRLASVAKLVADTGNGKEIDQKAAADAVALFNEVSGGLRSILRLPKV